MKKILIMTGSPRKKGNSTLLAEAFAEGVKAAGNSVNFFDTVKKTSSGCIACDRCWHMEKPCVIDDGFNEFAEMLTEADVLVIASPVYWGSYPAQLKAFIDRMYSYVVPWCQSFMESKELYLLACGDGENEEAFSVIETVTRAFSELLEWNYAGSVCVPSMVEEGDIKKTDALEKARKLGLNA